MIQLPATAAIECRRWALFPRGSFGFCPGGLLPGGTFFPGVFCPGALLAGGIFVREGFCPGGFLSGGLMPVPPKFNAYTPAPQIFRVCRGGGTLHISSKHYMGPTPFYGARAEPPPPPKKKPILP